VDDFPPLVERAYDVARRIGFALTREEAAEGAPSASLPGVGRFLAMLAAGCAGGQIGELGTGPGIGAAWIASAMPAGCSLVTVEIDDQRAAAARDLFAADSRVTVVCGDAYAVLADRGPFDLVFSDGGAMASVDWLRIGGRIVMDDVTPDGRRPVMPSASSSSATGGWSPSRSCYPACATRYWSARESANGHAPADRQGNSARQGRLPLSPRRRRPNPTARLSAVRPTY